MYILSRVLFTVDLKDIAQWLGRICGIISIFLHLLRFVETNSHKCFLHIDSRKNSKLPWCMQKRRGMCTDEQRWSVKESDW